MARRNESHILIRGRKERLRQDMEADGYDLRELSDGTFLVALEDGTVGAPNGWRVRRGGRLGFGPETFPGRPVGSPRPLSLDEVESWFRGGK